MTFLKVYLTDEQADRVVAKYAHLDYVDTALATKITSQYTGLKSNKNMIRLWCKKWGIGIKRKQHSEWFVSINRLFMVLDGLYRNKIHKLIKLDRLMQVDVLNNEVEVMRYEEAAIERASNHLVRDKNRKSEE